MKIQVALIFVFWAMASWAQPEKGAAEVLQDKMIWSGIDTGKAEYTVFRKTFTIQDVSNAMIHLFADARYILWLNGVEVSRGPCRFDPKSPSFDSIDIAPFLQQGLNAVAVMVMSHGSNGKMMNHAPGLCAKINLCDQSQQIHTIWTDESWKWNSHTRFMPPVQDWGVVCDRVDARMDDGDWSLAKYDDHHWQSAVSIDGRQWGKLVPRPIPLLKESEMGWTALNKSALPAKLKQGQSYIIQAREMLQGFPIIRFTAEEGAVIQFEFGYTGDSLTIGNTYGSACFYTARAGDQTYVPTDSYGFRYLKISVLNGSIYSPYNVLLTDIQLVDRRFPYLETGAFICNDPFLNELWQRSIRTLKLNCEDGYMDCALREKVEWMGDAAIVEYPLSLAAFAIADGAGMPRSDSGLMISMLRHIALSQSDSGMFKAHHPSDRFDIHAYIEDYSCLWVQALRQVYELTANLALVNELWQPLKKQMQWFADHRSPNGLVYGREFTFMDNPLAYCYCNGATLNAFVYKAFNDAAFLASVKKDFQAEKSYHKLAEEIKQSYNKHLWNPAKKTYSSGIADQKQMMPTAHAALMALNRGIVPANRKQSVKEYLYHHYRDRGKSYSQNGLIPDLFFHPDLPVNGIDSPYTSFWMLEELFKDNRDVEALSFIREKWQSMMQDSVTGTLSEGFGGGDLCHNMGAVPAYFLSRKVLGVSERLPVSSKIIEIKPQLGDLSLAQGTVLTVHGPVAVKWERQNDRLLFSIDIPEGTTAQITIAAKESDRMLLLNNQKSTFRLEEDQLIFNITKDIHCGAY